MSIFSAIKPVSITFSPKSAEPEVAQAWRFEPAQCAVTGDAEAAFSSQVEFDERQFLLQSIAEIACEDTLAQA